MLRLRGDERPLSGQGNRRQEARGLDCQHRTLQLFENSLGGIANEKTCNTGSHQRSHNNQISPHALSGLRYYLSCRSLNKVVVWRKVLVSLSASRSRNRC